MIATPFRLKNRLPSAAFAPLIYLHTILGSAGDSLKPMPPLHPPRPQLVDVRHMAFDLRFDIEKRLSSGTAVITLAPLSATGSVELDAGFLTINSVENGPAGHPLKFENDGKEGLANLKIDLGRTVAAGEVVNLKIDYRSNFQNPTDPGNLWGSFGRGLRFFQPTATEPRKRRQIWSMGEPEGNRFWLPGIEQPTDFFTSEMTATVGPGLTAVSNGLLVEKKDNPDGSRTFRWKADAPHAFHQLSIAVGEYVDVEQVADGVKLHSFCYPDEVEATRATVVRLPEMARFFAELTGEKLPFGQYSQVFAQEFAGNSDYHATSTITENMVDDRPTHADYFYLWDGTEAQALAAQWFGQHVSPADWSDVWLFKSLQVYLDCLFSEKVNGLDEVQLWNRQFQISTSLGDFDSGVRRPLSTRNYETAAGLAQDNSPFRGALVLHMLRRQIGEAGWRRTLQNFTASYGGKTATTDDFRRAAEQASGQKLDWFFDQWVFKIGRPVFEVSQKFDSEKRVLALTVKQLQRPDPTEAWPQAEFFRGKMRVEIDGRVEEIELLPQAEQVFSFASNATPMLVNFNFGSDWLCEINFAKTLGELFYQFQNSRDVLARRSAMLGLAELFKKPETIDEVKWTIEKAFRRVIKSRSYWRLRYSAMLTLQSLLAPDPSQPARLDRRTKSVLLNIIEKEKSWDRAAAIGFLGATRDPKFAPVYLKNMGDESDRVVSSAAIALGKCRAAGAFEALAALPKRPSWKNQSLLSALAGLKELGDERGTAIALEALKDEKSEARWTLAVGAWDFRIAAAQTLFALNKGELGLPVVLSRFEKAMAEGDVNDIFSNLLLLSELGDGRAKAAFEAARERFKGDEPATSAVDFYENQLNATLKN